MDSLARPPGVRRDPLPTVGLAVALLLVSAPLWLVPHAGETSTTYVAERIEYGPSAGGGIRTDGAIRGLDCYEIERTRGCLFAERIVAEGPVTVEPTGLVLSADSFEDAPYVAVGTDPPFHRRRVTTSAGVGDDRIRYALEPVRAETVLREVSRPETDLPPRLRSVLDGRTVTVHGRHFDVDGLVVRSDGAYYRVSAVDRSEPTWDDNPVLVFVVRGLPFVTGLLFLRERWRSTE